MSEKGVCWQAEFSAVPAENGVNGVKSTLSGCNKYNHYKMYLIIKAFPCQCLANSVTF